MPHHAHKLRDGALLHEPAVMNDASGRICDECDKQLRINRMPALALANGMWIGSIPTELAILSLPERILVAKYFPAAYVVKLYPKSKNAHTWDRQTMQSGLRGNVSTFKLNTADIAHLVTAGVMPPPAKLLAATIGITFVGPKGQPLGSLPHMFNVKRQRVYDALLWLKEHNPLYADITISETNLGQLPVDGIPNELQVIAKCSDDGIALGNEHSNYVPEDETSEPHTSNCLVEAHQDILGIKTEDEQGNGGLALKSDDEDVCGETAHHLPHDQPIETYSRSI